MRPLQVWPRGGDGRRDGRLPRSAGEPPKESAANRQQKRQNQQFSPGHALRATFSVIPGQDQRDEEADTERDDDEAHRFFGPAKSLRDDVDPLEERERGRDISHRPLHQLALFQALQEFVHRAGILLTEDVFRQQGLETSRRSDTVFLEGIPSIEDWVSTTCARLRSKNLGMLIRRVAEQRQSWARAIR